MSDAPKFVARACITRLRLQQGNFCRVLGGPEHDQDDFGWRFGFSSNRNSWR
jgi:hypothetical protein